LETAADKELPELTEEEILAGYKEREASYTTTEAFELHTIQLTPPEDREVGEAQAMAKELEDKLKGVTSLEDFRALAQEIRKAGGPGATTPENGTIGRVQSINIKSNQLEAIRGVEIPGLTPVIIEEGVVLVYWVAAQTPGNVKPLDEVRELLVEELKALRREKFLTEKLDNLAAEQQVKLLLP
jgi:hypothetical protein